MFFMFIYITVGLAAYILFVLLYLSYILTFFAHTFFWGVSGDTTIPMLVSVLREGDEIRGISITGELWERFEGEAIDGVLLSDMGGGGSIAFVDWRGLGEDAEVSAMIFLDFRWTMLNFFS